MVREETNSEDAKGKDEKTSTVNNKKEVEQESLNSLDVDIDNEDLDEDEENNDVGSAKKATVKLSSILPKPNKSRNSTPASSSKKGMPGYVNILPSFLTLCSMYFLFQPTSWATIGEEEEG